MELPAPQAFNPLLPGSLHPPPCCPFFGGGGDCRQGANPGEGVEQPALPKEPRAGGTLGERICP